MQKSPSAHHRTILSGYIFATKAHIDNRKKTVKQQYILHMSSQYGELQSTSGSDLLASLGHPSKFQLLCFQWGSVSLRSDIKGTELPPANPLERQLIALQLCRWQYLYNETL